MKHAIILALIAGTLIFTANAISGTATFYNLYFRYGTLDPGTKIVAVGHDVFDNGTACGRSYTVRCTGPANQGMPNPCGAGEVTIKVIDVCDRCEDNQLQLCQQAFSMIADPDDEKIRIDYE